MKHYKHVGIAPAIVRVDASLKNAQAEGKTAFEFNKKSNACQDIDILTQDMLGLKSFIDNDKRAIQ
jgi:hypothetical protein